MQPITNRRVEPAVNRAATDQNPTAMRYCWNPYGPINLMGPDGTCSLYVQPHEIEDGEGGTIPNPYHRVLPKGQLIPFPTFNAVQQMPSPDLVAPDGRPVMVTGITPMSAHAAAVTVLGVYSVWGFTICNSLQGLDQETAFHIFQVVHPFDYPMRDIVTEMAFGALERIDATETITFPAFPGYQIGPLTDRVLQVDANGNELTERTIATKLASELLAGAEIAVTLAKTTLDSTEADMVKAYAGGKGKVGPDALDQRLSAEMGRDLPKMIGTESKTAELENKIDFLVGREASRADKEEIQRLRDELEAEKKKNAGKGTSADDTTGTKTICGFIKADETECQMPTKNGERCGHHKDK